MEQIAKSLPPDKFLIHSESGIESLKKSTPALTFLEGFFSYYAVAFALRKDFPWANETKRLFKEYGQDGFFYRVDQKYMATERCNQGGVVPTNQGIRVESFVWVFAIMAISAFIALFVEIAFLGKRWYHGKNNRVNS